MMEQSGLVQATPNRSKHQCFLGSDEPIDTCVDRLSLKLGWNDSYIVLHKAMIPVATAHTQRFLQTTCRQCGNTVMDNPDHPTIQLATPDREIRPRLVPTQPRTPFPPSPRRQRSAPRGDRRTKPAPVLPASFEEEKLRTISLTRLFQARTPQIEEAETQIEIPQE
jgi:hypothetical protein